MIAFLKRLFLFMIPLVCVCELFFRFIIPAGRWGNRIQDTKYGIMKFDTTQDREGLYTSGRLAQQRSYWRINNCGWNSQVDYFPSTPDRKPLIAVIGNSYIEGFSVEQDENLAPLLQNNLNNDYDVYSIGQAGASLAQFMNLARYAKAEFEPDIYVFVVMESDLRDAIKNYGSKPKELQIEYRDGAFLEISPVTVHANKYKQLLRYSATLWYLTSNAHLTFFGGTGNPNPADNSSPKQKIDDILLANAADYIVKTINSELSDKKVVFVVDGARRDIYAHKSVASFKVAGLLTRSTQKFGGSVLDLTPIFDKEFIREGRKFNYDHDFHWNAYGYKTVASALSQFLQDSTVTHNTW